MKAEWNNDFECLKEQYSFLDYMINLVKEKLIYLKNKEVPNSFSEYIKDIDVGNVINSKEENIELTCMETTEVEDVEENEDIFDERLKPNNDSEFLEKYELQMVSMMKDIASRSDKEERECFKSNN